MGAFIGVHYCTQKGVPMKYNPDIHHRHTIRLQHYDYSKEGLYFITSCIKKRECILGNIDFVGTPAHRCPDNSNMLLSNKGYIVKKCLENINDVYDNLKLDYYIIMPNHIHIIIYISTSGHLWAGVPTKQKNNISIPKIMNSLKTITSKQIGYPIWQHNYYEHIIRNEKEYYKIREYIKYNPFNWKDDEYNC